MAKKFIKCKTCENRIMFFETGFVGESYLVCTSMGCHVDEYDGCTLGVPGPSKFGIQRPYDIDLSDYQTAVYGYHPSYTEEVI